MESMIDFALEELKQIKPGSKNLLDKQMQIVYHETIENEIDNTARHREEL
jgi:hypothetical protein